MNPTTTIILTVRPLSRSFTITAGSSKSVDHKWPWGTAFDNGDCNFNLKLYALFDYRYDCRVIDIGCSGGGFVKSILEDGYAAVYFGVGL